MGQRADCKRMRGQTMDPQREESDEDVLPRFPGHLSWDTDSNKAAWYTVNSSGMHAIFEVGFDLGVEERCEIYRACGNEVVPADELACALNRATRLRTRTSVGSHNE